MQLIDEMEATGRWLFRWRSYLPFVTVVLLFVALDHFTYPFGSHWWDEAWESVCLAASLAGLALRVVTTGYAPKGMSGRNMKRQVAEQLNTTGMYSIVRNPVYVGNFLIALGMSLFPRLWWIPLVYTLLFALYYERIVFAEEVFLRREFGRRFEDWAARTPAFLPRPSRWQPPASPFNLRKVLRQEHQTLFGIIVVFYCLEVVGDYFVDHELFADAAWNVAMALAVIFFLTIRALRKYTTVLKDRKPQSPDAAPSSQSAVAG
jgi:protein-S-isoprenylcysteine O-methyltransferase Ste14